DPSAGDVGTYSVSLNGVSRAAWPQDVDPGVVAGDQVAGPGCGAADHVIRPAHFNAGKEVADADGAREVGADVVALYPIPAGGEADPVAVVAGDQVAGPRVGAADSVPGRSDRHACLVAECGCPRDVGADEVALDEVAGGAKQDAHPPVPRDHVA